MLPKVIAPIYELTLPSTGKTISYRPFLVKEEKLLLIAAQSQDPKEIKTTTLQIIENCLIDKFDIQKAPLFDIEYILVNLRLKSVGNRVEQDYVCNNILEQEKVPCNTPFKVKLNFIDLEIVGETKPNKKIDLGNGAGILLRYPRFSFSPSKEDFDYELLREVIETVYDSKATYTFAEETKEEQNSFLDSLSKEQFEKIEEFLSKLPHYEINTSHVCTKCGFEHKIKVEDLQNFF